MIVIVNCLVVCECIRLLPVHVSVICPNSIITLMIVDFIILVKALATCDVETNFEI